MRGDTKILGIVKKNYLKFQLNIIDNVRKSGSGAGIAASSQRGIAWKWTKVSNLYEYFTYFFNNSGNFWVRPRIWL